MESDLTSGICGSVLKIEQLLIVIGISFLTGSLQLLMTRRLVH
jgi:hypothetical protein